MTQTASPGAPAVVLPPPPVAARASAPPAPVQTVRRRSHAVAWVIALLLFLLAGAVGTYALWPAPEPADTIADIREAFANHDATAFEQYVDVDSVFSDALEQLADRFAASIAADQTAENQQVSRLGARLFVDSIVRAEVLPGLKIQTRQWVSGGTWRGPDDVDSQTDDQVAMGFLHSAFEAGLTYEDSWLVNESGGSAVVDVHMGTLLRSNPVTLKLALERDSGRWVVTKILDLERLQLTREQ